MPFETEMNDNINTKDDDDDIIIGTISQVNPICLSKKMAAV